MKSFCAFLMLALSFSLTGCGGAVFGPPPWHFNGDTDDAGGGAWKAPQAFIDQANADFAMIIPAYESKSYPNDFDSRFENTPTTLDGFKIGTYFDPHARFLGQMETFNATPAPKATLLFTPPPPIPPEEWQNGYFTAKSSANFVRQYPKNPGSGLLTALTAFGTGEFGAQSQKMYGFLWQNDFSQSTRQISASPVGISFTYTWGRYASVPTNVSLTGKLEEKVSVCLDYDDKMKLTGNCSFPEMWGVSPLH